MNDLGLVSIITPTYNCGRFIGETIESVQAQTYIDWEMIIVDDCSFDNTRKVVEEYQKKDSRIQYYCLDKNSGAAIARNTALRLAKGRWIAFLDSDDLWVQTKLEHQIKFMVKNGYHFTCTERDVIDEESNYTGKYLTGPLKVTKRGMLCYCWLGCLTVMYDRSVVGLIQIKDIKKNNDYAIWLKAVKKADCYLLKENLGSYRIRSGSISRQNALKLIKWHYKLFREAEGYDPITASLLTGLNMVGGCLKKAFYVKRLNNGDSK